MSNPTIHYSTGLPVFVTINPDGTAEIHVDLSEAYESVFDAPGLYLDDEAVEDLDDADLARIRAALNGAPAFARVSLKAEPGEATVVIP